ncbi:MAG: ABC transporter permease [Methanomicrobia archaeon]|nr:ABC transporter permease [Methanomicrobia archaeon]
MKLRDYIIRRLILLIPILLGVTLLTFTVSHIIPADVARVFAGGEKANPETIARIRAEMHLDDPLYKQYYYYLNDLIHGNLGKSYSENRPVVDAIKQYFPATAELTVLAMLLAIPIGIITGIISAVRRNQWIDHVTRLIAITGVSIPIFWLALMLQIAFAYKYPILPLDSRLGIDVMAPKHITGLYIFDSLVTGNFAALKSSIYHLILPAFTLGYASLGIILRITRSSMLEIVRSDYIRTARAKGLKERTVIYKHALRNALIPTLTVSGLIFAGLLGGAVLTETIFNWPGMGRFAVNAVNNLDFSSVMGFTVIMAIIMVTANLIVDILYSVLDPRIRLGE